MPLKGFFLGTPCHQKRGWELFWGERKDTQILQNGANPLDPFCVVNGAKRGANPLDPYCVLIYSKTGLMH